MTHSAQSPAAPVSSAPRSYRLKLVLAALILVAGGVGAFCGWHYLDEHGNRRRALDLARAGLYGEAEPLLSAALDRAPSDVEVIEALVQAQEKNKRLLTEAEPLVSRWCELEPDNPVPLQKRLAMWQRMQRRDRALSDALRLLELEPDNGKVRKNAAHLLMLAGRFNDAERECRLCLADSPGDPELRMLLAKVHHVQGHAAEAAAVLDPLLGDRPSHAEALLLRGTLYADAGQYAQAIPLLERVLTAKPAPRDRQKARYYLSQALARTGQTKEADAVLAQLQRDLQIDRLVKDSNQQPDNLELKVQAAEGLLEEGDSDGAVRWLLQVLARDGDYRAAHRVLAVCYERQGRTADAAFHRRRAGLTNP